MADSEKLNSPNEICFSKETYFPFFGLRLFKGTKNIKHDFYIAKSNRYYTEIGCTNCEKTKTVWNTRF